MKKRIILGFILACTIAISACGVKKDVGNLTDNGSDADKSENALFDAFQDEETQVNELPDNHTLVEVKSNGDNPAEDTYVFINSDNVIELSGFGEMGMQFYNGVIEAETIDGEEVLVDINGNIVASLKDYKFVYRINGTNDYFKVTDRETELEGVIDNKGNIIVPCEYEDITFPWSSETNGFAITAKTGDLTDVYTSQGYMLADDVLIDEYACNYHKDIKDDYGIIDFSELTDGKVRYFSEATGKEIVSAIDGWEIHGIDVNNRISSIENIDTGEKRIVIMNEDYSEWSEISEWEDMRYYTVNVIDGKYLFNAENEHKLFDDKGQLLAVFEMQTIPGKDSLGNEIIFGKGEDKCVLWDANGTEIKALEGIYFQYYASEGMFAGYPIVNGEVTKVVNMYDLDGNIVFENVKNFWTPECGYWNKNGDYIIDRVSLLTLDNDKILAKTEEMEAYQEIGEGEEWDNNFYGYIVFEKDNELIIRDKKMTEVGRISSEAYPLFFSATYMLEIDGTKKYYSCKGEFIIEQSE